MRPRKLELLKVGEYVTLGGLPYEVKRTEERYWLSPLFMEVKADCIFEKIKVNKYDFQKEVLGYTYHDGRFSFCESLKDLTIFALNIQDRLENLFIPESTDVNLPTTWDLKNIKDPSEIKFKVNDRVIFTRSDSKVYEYEVCRYFLSHKDENNDYIFDDNKIDKERLFKSLFKDTHFSGIFPACSSFEALAKFALLIQEKINPKWLNPGDRVTFTVDGIDHCFVVQQTLPQSPSTKFSLTPFYKRENLFRILGINEFKFQEEILGYSDVLDPYAVSGILLFASREDITKFVTALKELISTKNKDQTLMKINAELKKWADSTLMPLFEMFFNQSQKNRD